MGVQVEPEYAKIRELVQNTRLVFDYLKMTKNSCAVGCL